jgi:hypothetical protein
VGADVDDVGDVADGSQGLFEDHAVVRRIGGAEFGPFGGVFGPGEAAAVDDGSADVDAVAPEEFGGGVDDDVDAVVDGLEENGGQDGVVADDGQALIVGSLGDGGVVGDIVAGIADGFDEDAAGVGIGEAGDL